MFKIKFLLQILLIVFFIGGCTPKKSYTLSIVSKKKSLDQNATENKIIFAKNDSLAYLRGLEIFVNDLFDYYQEFSYTDIGEVTKPLRFSILNEKNQMINPILNTSDLSFKLEYSNEKMSLNQIHDKIDSISKKRASLLLIEENKELERKKMVKKLIKKGHITLDYNIDEIREVFKLHKKKFQYWDSIGSCGIRHKNKMYSITFLGDKHITLFYEDVNCPGGKSFELNKYGLESTNCQSLDFIKTYGDTYIDINREY